MNKVFSNYLELFNVSYHYKNKLENVRIFKNLNLIKNKYDTDPIHLKLYEEYFDTKEFKTLKKKMEKRGLKLSWKNGRDIKEYPYSRQNDCSYFCHLEINKYVKEKKNTKSSNETINKAFQEVKVELEKKVTENEHMTTDEIFESLRIKKSKDREERKLEEKKQKDIVEQNVKKSLKNFEDIKPDLEKIYNKFKNKEYKKIDYIKLTKNSFKFKVVESSYIDNSEIEYSFNSTERGYSYTKSGYSNSFDPITGEVMDKYSNNDIYATYQLDNKNKVISTIMEIFEKEISAEEWPD